MDKSKTAGFFRRYFAQVLDTFIGMSITIVPFFVLTFSAVTAYIKSPMELNPLSLVPPVALLFLMPIVIFFYSWYFTHKFGGTIGKLLFGLRIVDGNGAYIDKATAFWRMTVGYTISSTFLGLGYFWAFRKKEDLTWHDRFLGTKVLTVGKPIWGIVALVLLKILFIVLLVYFVTGVLPQFLSIPSVVPAPELGYTQPAL
ncbi:MAG: hypothetical protein UV83_C0016G0005 [candidate division WWE3 bacterium GW2011_GWE2_43_18]|uniref:RDD domain-containing protein n=3 Tax=Katanobacteria TaxID=422282 RepID=A0A1F4XDK7_UNCKA|nr:MAG: hypothetical protein UU59_C0010G0007 [candidate division WWE3 bacterium GW2011_GWE1_41_27]KKS60606.1 MAG: hypothetical protein UV26_C0003G0060 [candidate division WWE3 bacterium GW2011_GWF2_42_42]KKS63540.1 MAG: hypothetical protein UV31_C0008G0004 [candidate division WWE3 bacterium GW2011_GWF1_42_51]KKT04069.1 MAG: hypothetical protein UV83_C0016G0005 [candidate division WWE3 bacterium GW2011_GWE2_43_18]OGC79742.1 MAG: hypothetical protein A3K01_00540 [candidate division WWE3 bacterium